MARYLFTTKPENEVMGSEHIPVRIISSTSPDLRSGPSEVRDILSASCSGIGGYRTLFQINGKDNFLFWAQEVFESTSWTFDQALGQIERHLQQQKSEATVVLFSYEDPADEKTARQKMFMVSLLSLKAEAAKSFALSYQDRQALEDDSFNNFGPLSREKRGYVRRNLAFVIAALILVILGAILAALPYLGRYTPHPDLWITWKLPKGSKGPQNQLQYTWPHPNFTSWSAKNDYNADDFYLRLDDQTMIPTEYVDEHELKYQAWYAERYPWFAEIRASKAYLNESYWRDARSFPLAYDKEFHVAHCVMAAKRYWKARETNHHVCPRDLDHHHISHCFDILESHAFVSLLFRHKNVDCNAILLLTQSLLQGFEMEHPIDPKDETSLMWIVNACF